MSANPASLTFKCVLLLTLAVKTSVLILLTRYSRERPVTLKYSSSVIIFLIELFKIPLSIIIELFTSKKSIRQLTLSIYQDCTENRGELALILLPAVLMALYHWMGTVSIEFIDGLTYQVVFQVKIITAAAFSIFLLNKHVNKSQWLSFVVLLAGIFIMNRDHLHSIVTRSIKNTGNAGAALKAASLSLLHLKGFIWAISAAALAGFTGVLVEWMLKTNQMRPRSTYLLSIYYATFGTIAAASIIASSSADRKLIQTHGLFAGIDHVVSAIIFGQVLSGILLLLVLQYTDNILKSFSTTSSIIISAIFMHVLRREWPSLPVTLGTSAVVLSILLYSSADIVKFVKNARNKSGKIIPHNDQLEGLLVTK